MSKFLPVAVAAILAFGAHPSFAQQDEYLQGEPDYYAELLAELAPKIRAYPLTPQRTENFFTSFAAMERAVAKYNTPEKQAEAASYGERYMAQMAVGVAASKAASMAMSYLPPPAHIAMGAVTEIGNMFGMDLSPQALIMQAAMSGLDSLPNELQKDFGPEMLGRFKSQDEFMATTLQMSAGYSELKHEETQGQMTREEQEAYAYASQYKNHISPQQMQSNLAILRPMKAKLYHAFKDDEEVPPGMQ